MKSALKRIIMLGILCSPITISTAVAEQYYVSERMTLSLYQDTSLSTRVASLKSGDKVEVIKSDDGYSQVKATDGTVGWVRQSYLVKEKPAVIRVNELQDELDRLRSKHADMLIEQTGEPAIQDTGMLSRLEAAESMRHNLETRIADLEAERTRHIKELGAMRKPTDKTQETHDMLLWVILPILTMITGFFLGWKYMDSKIRARFSGYSPL